VSHRGLGEHYEENEDPIGTPDLATLVWAFLRLGLPSFFRRFLLCPLVCLLVCFLCHFPQLALFDHDMCLRVSGPSLTCSSLKDEPRTVNDQIKDYRLMLAASPSWPISLASAFLVTGIPSYLLQAKTIGR
jgi:hypothetical protein